MSFENPHSAKKGRAEIPQHAPGNLPDPDLLKVNVGQFDTGGVDKAGIPQIVAKQASDVVVTGYESRNTMDAFDTGANAERVTETNFLEYGESLEKLDKPFNKQALLGSLEYAIKSDSFKTLPDYKKKYAEKDLTIYPRLLFSRSLSCNSGKDDEMHSGRS